jgi:cytochrome c nitrite reductase small subunit
MSRRSRLAVAVAVAGGVALGLGAFTFGYAKGYSYLTNDPAACANCHVMTEHFDAWNRSSHRAVAVCNDCHTPHNFLGKYAIKAQNGFWHSFYFTTGTFHEPIRINPRNARVTEQTCRDCHAPIVAAIDPQPSHAASGALSCVSCHRNVGHLH